MNNTTLVINSSSSTGSGQSFMAINYVDFGFRCSALLVYILYIMSYIKNKNLKAKPLILLNHVNFIYFLNMALLVSYINTRFPNTRDPAANRVLCVMTEFAWMILKYIKVYSLLVLAVYRYLAVFHIGWYKKLNERLVYLLALIGVSWLLCVIMSVVLKYAFGTTYSIYFCTDGYSDELMNSILYYVVNSLVSSVLPLAANFIIYVKIYVRIRDQIEHTQNDHNSKTLRFAKQFFVLNIVVLLTVMCSLSLDFILVISYRPQFAHLWASLAYVRPLLRITCILLQAFIPVISLYFLPRSTGLFSVQHTSTHK